MMGNKRKRNVSHDGLVIQLADDLRHDKKYKSFHMFMEYCRNGYCGEVDLLAMGRGFWDFYEIKTTYSFKSVKKATEQYERFRRAYHGKDIGGFLYTKDGIIRRL